MKTQRALFAETTRVFLKIWKSALLIIAIYVAVTLVPPLLHANGLLDFLPWPDDQNSTSFNDALLQFSQMPWFYLGIVLIFMAYREHFELRGLNRRDTLTRLVWFGAGAVVLYKSADWLAGKVLAPLPDLIVSNAHAQPWVAEILATTAWVLTMIVICLFGSWLPAAMTKGDLSPGATLRRGIRQFPWTFGQVLLGPGLLFLVHLGAGKILYTMSPQPFSGPALAGPMAGLIGFGLWLIAGSILLFLSLYINVMVALILSQALERDERNRADTDRHQFAMT